jgi:uncharacterized membrane protein (UPF0127 family)
MTGIFKKNNLMTRARVFFVAAALSGALAGGLMLSVQAHSESREHVSPAGLRVDQLVIVKQDGLRENFNVEIAENGPDVQKGLMFRTDMPRDAGMLFYFGGGEGEVAFWMKNTLIPLDMIFIRGDGSIAHIHENAVPQSLQSVPSQHPVAAVLEINGGETAARGIQIGDRVDHPYFRRTRPADPAPQQSPEIEPQTREEKAAKDAETAPLPKLEIQTPEQMDRGRERGLDADLQQR